MSLTIHPVDNTFAAEVHGIGPLAAITAGVAYEIEQALATHPVLCFRNANLDDDGQQAFIEHFGPPVEAKLKELTEGAPKHPHMYDFSTVDEDGNPVKQNSARGLYLLANQLWHTDGTQIQPPIRISALSARKLPPVPPPTEYADMRAAWDALPPERQRALEGLMVEHSVFASRAKVGMTDFSAETRAERPPVMHPLVRTHSRSGRKSLYLASHASHVEGMPLEQGEALLRELTEFATCPQFLYSHRWSEGDLLMWDDSCTMHRATPYSGTHPRIMRWCGVREPAPV